MDSGSWGRGFDSRRVRSHDPAVVGLVSAGVDPALHPSQGGRLNGYYRVSRRIMRPPGVAPWLYRSLGTGHFDDIVLHPRAEESAGFPYYYQ